MDEVCWKVNINIGGMTNYLIKQIDESEVALLQAIAQQTFIEAFSAQNTAANMEAYLQQGLSKKTLLAELQNNLSNFYFLWVNNKVGGYLKLNFGAAQTEIKQAQAMEIERIYVLEKYYGAGWGQRLFDFAQQIALSKKIKVIWLGVWEKNERAIAFYRKNGLHPFSTHPFMLGSDIQTDILMKKDLLP